jgi:ubiquinone/menaquinone biosynthesis C-methylase UbiE
MKGRLLGGSVTFDDAADIYDATRALPDDVAAKLTEAILAELAALGYDRLLEIGIGTGRIARPLAERGIRVTGVDIAPRMLGRLREQLGPGHTTPDLLLGDATRLPMADGSYRAAMVVHLLHLVSSLDGAIAELRRVLVPGGVLLQNFTHWPGDNPWMAAYHKWDEMLAKRNFERRKRPRDEEIVAAIEAGGGTRRTVEVASEIVRSTPAEHFERTSKRTDSWSWFIPDDLFAECLPEFEDWCRHHYGHMQRVFAQEARHELDVWSFSTRS